MATGGGLPVWPLFFDVLCSPSLNSNHGFPRANHWSFSP